MEKKNELDQGDEIMLPGFRFHPTDEELVTFYLRRKVQQRPLSIELIKQLDIYKFDPWDLPKEMATIGEKEWYFYCPRDRKYRNSNRPNRVTSAGFWKATGTDRPIYSSDGTKCIGLKKSLVFYKGRAAKGTKTDWMMHEFRLPTVAVSNPCKRSMDKDLPPNDSWAICRIFKKSTVAQRAPPHMWAPTMADRAVESSNNNYLGGLNFNNNNDYRLNEVIPNLNQTSAASTNISCHMAADHIRSCSTDDLQYSNYYQEQVAGTYKLGAKSTMPVPAGIRSISFPNLDFSNTLDFSHLDPSVKNTLNFMTCMLQIPSTVVDHNSSQPLPPPKTHHQDDNVSPDHYQADGTCIAQQQSESLLKKNNILSSLPISENDMTTPLPFQSNLFDAFKDNVSTSPWDIPTSTIL